MRKLYLFVLLILAISNISFAQKTKPIKPQCMANFVQLTFGGGFTRPTGWMTDTYNPSGNVFVDFTYKPNFEVGLFLENNYSFMNVIDTLAPTTGFWETAIGARYYFASKNVRSTFFFETSVGTYIIFTGSWKTISGGTVDSKTDVKFGANAGFGTELVLTDNIYITLKAKYHNIFNVDGLMNYIGAGAGLTFRL